MDRGDEFVLLEMLGEGSYRQGHLPGAIRVQDPNAAPEVIPDKDTLRAGSLRLEDRHPAPAREAANGAVGFGIFAQPTIRVENP